jgi:hypothetical protein
MYRLFTLSAAALALASSAALKQKEANNNKCD